MGFENFSGSLYVRYNRDTNNNVKVEQLANEPLNIYSSASIAILAQIPLEKQRVVIKDPNGVSMIEVFDAQPIEPNNFKVSYDTGIVWFHPSIVGKTGYKANYGGLGLIFVSPYRILYNVDEDGNLITMGELWDKIQKELEAIEYLGGASEIVEKLKATIKEGEDLDAKLLITIANGNLANTNWLKTIADGNTANTKWLKTISDGNALNTKLEANIVEVNKWFTQLDQNVKDGKVLVVQLTALNAEARTTINDLNDVIDRASDIENIIKETDNKSITIKTTDWVGTEPNLTYTWQHNLVSKNLVVTVLNKDSDFVAPNGKIVDSNNIMLRSRTRDEITLVISARYGMLELAEQLKIEIANSNTALTNLQAENGKATTNINNLKAESTTSITNLNNLKTENATSITNKNNLKSENDKSASNITNLKNENTNAGTNYTNLNTENGKAVYNFGSLATENSKVTSNITNLQTENAKATPNITSLTDLNNKAEQTKRETEQLIATGGATTKEEMKIYIGELPIDGGTFFEQYDTWEQDGGNF